jgi:hypothetical protein
MFVEFLRVKENKIRDRERENIKKPEDEYE